jgi:hypothetical protein
VDERELRLDGNAAAGVLAALFGGEMTGNWTTCDGCGADHQIGALMAYSSGMGTVLRCPGCDTVQLRLAEVKGRVWLDLRGARCLQIAAG